MDLFGNKNKKIIYLEGMCSNVVSLGVQSFSLTAFALYFNCSTFWLSVISSLPIGAQVLQIFFEKINKISKTRKNSIIISAAVGRIFFLLIPLAVVLKINKQELLIFTVAVYSIFNSFNLGIWTAIINDTVPPRDRNRFFSIRYVFIALTTIIFSYIGGVLLNLENRDTGIFLLGAIIGVSGIISVILFYLQKVPEVSNENKANNLLIPFKDVEFKKFLMFVAVWNFAVEFSKPYYILFTTVNLEVPYSYIGSVASIGAIFTVISYPFMGKLAEKYGNKKLIAKGIITTTYMILLYCFMGSWNYRSTLLVDAVGSAIAWCAIYLCMFNLFLEVASEPVESYIASYYVTVGASGMLGGIVGGVVGNFLKDVDVSIIGDKYSGLQVIFIIAIVLRIYSVLLLTRVNSFETGIYYEGLKSFTLSILGLRK